MDILLKKVLKPALKKVLKKVNLLKKALKKVMQVLIHETMANSSCDRSILSGQSLKLYAKLVPVDAANNAALHPMLHPNIWGDYAEFIS